MVQLHKKSKEISPIIIDVSSSLQSINFFLVKSNHSLTLIDAGLDNETCWNALIQTLQTNGFTLYDLTEIILTHNHIDHVGLVNRIVTKHPIPVYAHRDAIPRLKRDPDFFQMRTAFFAKLYEEMGCKDAGYEHVAYLQRAIQKNKQNALQTEITPIESTSFLHFHIVEVPGHSPDQIALYDSSNGYFFSGDLLIKHISSNALVEPDNEGKRLLTLVEHKHSLEKILSIPIELVFPGHGTLINNPKELISKRLNGIERKAEKIRKLVKSGISTGSELAQAYYGNKYKKQFSLVMSEIIGHLDYLEARGKVTKKLKEGVYHYSIHK